eukprot:TRINITY_DN4600_c0_g1_i6.p4 TRINITY_DN4600_c0_g1~~TRINITY_DN4600_c0_g1_i6.p4  ORF type:complete len:141 (-),score=35.78 TRINITY_DN4600_c0_g1_i6:1738-2160(-)
MGTGSSYWITTSPRRRKLHTAVEDDAPPSALRLAIEEEERELEKHPDHPEKIILATKKDAEKLGVRPERVPMIAHSGGRSLRAQYEAIIAAAKQLNVEQKMQKRRAVIQGSVRDVINKKKSNGSSASSSSSPKRRRKAAL